MRKFLFSRLLALIAFGTLFWSAPALAGFTHVAGTGTCGTVICPVFIPTPTGGAAVTAALNVGDVVEVTITDFEAGVNNDTCNNVDGSGLNTWQLATGGAAISHAGKHVCWSILSHALSNGTTLTVGTDAPDFIMSATAFRPAATAAFDTNATAATGTGGGSNSNVTVGPTPTLACPAGATNCEVCVGGVTWSNTGTTGSDATWITVGGAGAGQQFLDAFVLKNSSSPVSYVATMSTASLNYAGAVACFKDTPAAGPVKKFILHTVP